MIFLKKRKIYNIRRISAPRNTEFTFGILILFTLCCIITFTQKERMAFLMADNMFLNEDQYIMYRGKPLVRAGNTICYGNMSDKHVLFMIIISEKTVTNPAGDKEISIPDRILIQILSTDTKKPAHERIAKQLEKQGLFDAMDIGIVWLDRLNAA